jgi:hypothetical protein
MSEPPLQGPFCQICRGPWPDGHKDWCPIKTGQPVPGDPSLQQQWPQGIQSGNIQGIQGGLASPAQASPTERLSLIIEHLCDHLRELRRENPDHYFGTPYENLYRSLDAGLDSFYHAKKPKP